jgi:CheY-specific phosphatase CheX
MLEVNQLLDILAGEILETMFFSGVIESGEHAPEGKVLTALVSFSGPYSGALGVCAHESAAQALAANFLGDEEATNPEHATAIVGELANVFCGAALGSLDTSARFAISPPEVSCGCEMSAMMKAMPARRGFQLSEGLLAVGMMLDKGAYASN